MAGPFARIAALVPGDVWAIAPGEAPETVVAAVLRSLMREQAFQVLLTSPLTVHKWNVLPALPALPPAVLCLQHQRH